MVAQHGFFFFTEIKGTLQSPGQDSDLTNLMSDILFDLKFNTLARFLPNNQSVSEDLGRQSQLVKATCRGEKECQSRCPLCLYN